MRTIKKLFCGILTCTLLFAGCSNTPKESDPEDSLGFSDVLQTPASSMLPSEASLQSASPAASSTAGVLQLEQTVAYAFEGSLYGAATYTNTGSSPMALSAATFSFEYAGGSIKSEFTPFPGKKDVVLPGETGCAVLFLPVEGVEHGQSVSVLVTLEAQMADEKGLPLRVEDARLIQNHPGFATLSGRLINLNEETCSLAMVYALFYDANDTLLGIWYFTRNAVLHTDGDTTFSSYMQALPIEDLAQNTASIRLRAHSIS